MVITQKQYTPDDNSIEGWLSKNESLLLYLLAKSSPGNIVEIGSWKGKSTVVLGQAVKENGRGVVYAIDPHKGEYGLMNGKLLPTFVEFRKNIKNAGLENFVKPLVKTSQIANKNWHKDISLLFIDGLHDPENALLDYRLWNKYIIDNGYIVLHDAYCGYNGPWEVCRKYLFRDADYQEFGTVGSIVFARKKNRVRLVDKILKRYRVGLLILGDKIHKSGLPGWGKILICHKIIKFMLLNTISITLMIG